MNQILNIFRKDTRRFWPEILLSVAVTAAFVLAYPVEWLPTEGSPHIEQLQALANVLTVLVPVSWWLLIGRVVHAESLVGDRQFWITRPYEWKKLLGAKLLFLVAWLYLPFLVAQSLLLVEAGFHPLSYIPGLLFNLLLTTGILVMPLFAMAAVTANFARLTLTLLGVLIVLLGAAFVSSLGNRYGAHIPSSDRFSLPLVLCLCGAAVLLQYAARRVSQARMLLIAAPVLVAAVAFATSRSQDSQVNRYYPPPASASAAPFQLQLAPDPKRQIADSLMERDTQKFIDVPLVVAGVADGYAIQIDNVRATFSGPNGYSWTSPWEAVHNQRYLPDSGEATLQIRVDRAAYERLKAARAGLHLSFALTRLRAGATTSVVLPTRDIKLPNFGVCSVDPDWAVRSYSVSLDCRSALHQPQLTHLTTLWSDKPCSSSQPGPEHTAVADGWTGDLNPDPAEFGITSVWTPYVYFDTGRVNSSSTQWRFCPGAPFRATQYYLVDRTQMELTIPDFQFPVR
jgi:hypothetical protein